MISLAKTDVELAPYILTMLIVFFLLGQYGRQAIAWILMKLYEFVIQKNPLSIL
jgi:hypothetical protein